MKLIDILVEELPKRGGWLRDVKTMTQDRVGNIWGYDCVIPRLKGGLWSSKSGDDLVRDSKIEARNLAVDWNTAIITREQYEAALAAKNEGWIEWGGGACPVEEGTLVDVKYRDGDDFPDALGVPALSGYGTGSAFWELDGYNNDIIAYRLHKPQEAEQAKSELNDCIEQDAATEWSGEGLPPVGCFCEVEDRDGMLVYGQGESGEVIAHVENTAVIRMSYGLGCFEAGFLRPLRTEAERRRDEVRKAIYAAMNIIDGDIADAIYDAIAAGKIPGVKLED